MLCSLLLAVHVAGSALVHRAEHSALLPCSCMETPAPLAAAQHANPAFAAKFSNKPTPQHPKFMAQL